MATDRFRHHETGQRSHVLYFRVLWTMALAKNRREASVFRFDDLFLAFLRSGYLKRLDWEFCLWLDRQQAALARFLYGHVMGSSPLNRGHEHQRAFRRCHGRDGHPRRLGGIQRGGGTCNDRHSRTVQQ